MVFHLPPPPPPRIPNPTHITPRPHKGPAYQSATVAGCSFPPSCLTKDEDRHYLLCGDMTIVWTQRLRLTIGLFPYVAQAEHTHLLCQCVCVCVVQCRHVMSNYHIKMADGSAWQRRNNYDGLPGIVCRASS